MKKIKILLLVLIVFAFSSPIKAQESVIYGNENYFVQFTYDNNWKAIEIVLSGADEIDWLKLKIIEFQPLEDGYIYVATNPVGNEISFAFYTNDELLIMTTPLKTKEYLFKMKNYGYDKRIFK